MDYKIITKDRMKIIVNNVKKVICSEMDGSYMFLGENGDILAVITSHSLLCFISIPPLRIVGKEAE